MSIIPNNVDPSKDYVTQGVNPPLTSNGLVYNQIYAHTGVIDSLSTTSTNGYSDPNLSITNSPNGLLSFDPTADTVWYSTPNFGGPGSAPVINTYTFSSNTYFNFTSFFVLNVPCYVELGFENNGVWTALPGQSTFIINGGPNIYATDDWFLIEYTAPYTLSSNNIAVRITRQQAVSQYDNSGNYTNVSYPVGIQQFSVKFNIQQVSDVPSSVISGTNTIVSQNALGFVENFSFVNYPTANMFSSASGSLYWKSAPQPVGDAIVYFYAKVSDPSPTTINRLYIDPLYSGCKFNVYYTTQTTSGGTIDPGTFYWSPVPQDFVLRNGIYELPQTSCTYLKFEFTQLVPEAYDLPFDTVNRTINTFPYYIEELYSELELGIVDGSATNYSLINNPNLTTQTQVNNQISPSTIFGLATQTVAGNNNWPSLAALNSSQIDNETTVGVSTASQITDPSISYKLLDQNGSYNGQSYTQFLQRKFNNNSVHVYNQLTIPQSWHESYFVGIKYITAFYENTYDELLSTPNTLLSKNGTNSGFYAQGTNYVQLNPDDIAVSPWFSTIDKFNSFNIAGLTSDWRSFLTQGQPINLDQTLMNNISGSLATMSISGASLNYVTSLGASSVYSVYASGTSYGIKSPTYQIQSNLLSYYDSNFIVPNGSSSPWYGISGTTISLSPSYSQPYKYSTASGTKPAAGVEGPDGNVWFTNSVASGGVFKVTPSGAITTYAFNNSGLGNIALGSDNNLWTFDSTNVYKITTGGVVTTYTIPSDSGYAVPYSGPRYIINGPDGNLWLQGRMTSSPNIAYLLKITTGGVITGYDWSNSQSFTTMTSDGTNIWILDYFGYIWKVSTSSPSTGTSYALPGGNPQGIVFDGTQIWCGTSVTTGGISKVSLSGVITNYSGSVSSVSVASISYDGSKLWISQSTGSNQIITVSPSAPTVITNNFTLSSGSESPTATTVYASPTAIWATDPNGPAVWDFSSYNLNTSVSGIVVTGSPYVAAYNFTLPGVYSVSGTTPWTVALGTSALGTIGYAEYTPASGVNYYFLINAETTASGNISLYTQFVNPSNNSAISGTLVSGTAISGTSQYSKYVLTGTNYSAGIPSNTIQVVVSGTIPYQLYEFGAYNSPTSIWTSSVDRNNMRISGVARTYLPNSNNGTYRASLIATDINGNNYELTYKLYQPNTLPVKTWFDIELESFTGTNYSTFTMQLVQTNNAIAETFYVAMLAPFYHPVRYEYTTNSGTSITSASGWYPITTGINDPSQFIAIASGSTASGIQVRMTALDPNIYISGVSVVPYYKQSPLYMNLDIDYLGSSFTNETPAHTSISNKPYFQLNKEVHPSIFNINRIAPGINTFYID